MLPFVAFMGALRGMRVWRGSGAIYFSTKQSLIPVFGQDPNTFGQDVLNAVSLGGVTAELGLPDADRVRTLLLRNSDGRTIFEGTIRITL